MTRDPYPAALMAEVRQMHAYGWTATHIHRVLLKRDLVRVPSVTTLQIWTNATYAESHRTGSRRRARNAGAATAKFRLPSDSPEYQAAFVERLRAEGMPWEGVARCCRVVFGGDWTARRVQQLAGELTAAVAA